MSQMPPPPKGISLMSVDEFLGTNKPAEKKEMTLPCLEEMGDIAPALAILLQIQADYARGDGAASRAMRDVARSALAVEIERYILMRLAPQSRPINQEKP